MGDRGQVLIKDEVYLYTHWSGTELQQDVRNALAKRWRWDDPEYLARIIFEEMIGDSAGEETGFGIGTGIHGDIEHPLIIVDCKNQKVILKDMEGKEIIKEYSFEGYLKETKEIEE